MQLVNNERGHAIYLNPDHIVTIEHFEHNAKLNVSGGYEIRMIDSAVFRVPDECAHDWLVGFQCTPTDLSQLKMAK